MRANLTEGHYVVIPSTFHKNEQGEFLLRLYFDQRWNPKEVTNSGGSSQPQAPMGRPRGHYYSQGGGEAYRVIPIIMNH